MGRQHATAIRAQLHFDAMCYCKSLPTDVVCHLLLVVLTISASYSRHGLEKRQMRDSGAMRDRVGLWRNKTWEKNERQEDGYLSAVFTDGSCWFFTHVSLVALWSAQPRVWLHTTPPRGSGHVTQCRLWSIISERIWIAILLSRALHWTCSYNIAYFFLCSLR